MFKFQKSAFSLVYSNRYELVSKLAFELARGVFNNPDPNSPYHLSRIGKRMYTFGSSIGAHIAGFLNYRMSEELGHKSAYIYGMFHML